eukprot:3261283-Prorocentrum_lima.AAC.1
MAFHSERKLAPRYACDELPFFKMIESWRPEHSLDDPMTLMEEDGGGANDWKEGGKGFAPCVN